MEELSPSRLYAKGGGIASDRTAALLAEADRGRRRRDESSRGYEARPDIDIAEQRKLRTELVSRCRLAEPDDYTAWLAGHLASGGEVTHEHDFPMQPGSVYVLTCDGILVPTLYGAFSVELIVPAGMTPRLSEEFHGRPGHSQVYFMDGFKAVGFAVPRWANT